MVAMVAVRFSGDYDGFQGKSRWFFELKSNEFGSISRKINLNFQIWS
jgi:hypothetical protein